MFSRDWATRGVRLESADDGSWNAYANRLIAGTLADFVKENRLLHGPKQAEVLAASIVGCGHPPVRRHAQVEQWKWHDAHVARTFGAIIEISQQRRRSMLLHHVSEPRVTLRSRTRMPRIRSGHS